MFELLLIKLYYFNYQPLVGVYMSSYQTKNRLFMVKYDFRLSDYHYNKTIFFISLK